MKARLDDFAAGYATEEECAQNIKKVYDKTGYVMDTHTSVASYVCECYQKNSGDNKKCVIESTASPYKLNANILHDLECDADKMKDTVKNILEV